MTLTLYLPDDLEAKLAREASQQGLALSEYVLRVLANGAPSGECLGTGAELVAYWQSEQLVGSRSDIGDSQVHARELRTQAERRNAN